MSFDIIEHLKSRGMDPNKFHVLFDGDMTRATFLLYNLSGQIVGYQRYNPLGTKKRNNDLDNRYYCYFPRATVAVWGLEYVNPNDRYLFVTEGIFDAVKIINAGYSAIAALTNDPRPIHQWLKTLNKHIVCIIDNDENASGSKLKKYGDDFHVVPDPYRDLGDMPQDEVTKFLFEIENPPGPQ